MKQNKNIFPSLSIAAALLIATMFASCTKAELEAPVVKQDAEISFGLSGWNTPSKIGTKGFAQSESKVLVKHNPDDPGSLGLSVTVVDGIDVPKSQIPVTKGHHITDIEAFDVASYYYTQSPSFDANYIPWQEYNNGFSNGKSYFWPSTGSMYFVARYPTKTTTYKVGENDVNVFSEDIYTNNDGNLQFSYQIPTSIENQRDIMVAVENVADNDAHAGTPVNLKFQHLLAAVQFKVGDMMLIKINSLSIENVKGGNITINYGENGWTYESKTSTNYDVIYSNNGEPNFDTSGLPTGSYIAGNDNGLTMFVMPQNIGADQKIKIAYTELATGESETKEISFNGDLAHSWQAGKTTTYVLNIGTTVDIKIPSPPDADAHYIRVDMPYDFTQLAQRGFKNFKATAYWEDDGNNDASSDKQDIYLKKSITNTNGEVTSTELTPLQQQGFYTDELWEVRYRVENNGNKTYIVGSEEGPERVNANILGKDNLDGLLGTGLVHLFLDENNGTKNRNGVLKVTGEIENKTITIGMGHFKQLCPSWNNTNVGVERFEDNDAYPFGFSYNRVVTYTNTQAQTYDAIVDMFGPVGGAIYNFLLRVFGAYVGDIVPDTDGMADGFVGVGKTDDEEHVKTITLNYSALNSVNSITTAGDGLLNTRKLYNYTGATDIAELEAQLDDTFDIGKSGSIWRKQEKESDKNPSDYAAFIALTRNRMREVHTIVSAQGEEDEPIEKAILHKVNEGNAADGVNESGEDIIEWFLPSITEAESLIEIGTGTESTPISPLNGRYWSSTAAADPDSDTKGYGYSYVYTNNRYTSNSSTEDRTSNLKVRAVRKKPTAN